MNDYEHMVIHKTRERELIESAQRTRRLRSTGRRSGRGGEPLRFQLLRFRGAIAKALRRLADGIDSYRAGCVDGQLTCE